MRSAIGNLLKKLVREVMRHERATRCGGRLLVWDRSCLCDWGAVLVGVTPPAGGAVMSFWILVAIFVGLGLLILLGTGDEGEVL
jgi:hypothetical protein